MVQVVVCVHAAIRVQRLILVKIRILLNRSNLPVTGSVRRPANVSCALFLDFVLPR